ncbi:MAG TPA: UDP-N-acetylmuramate dehydrogenase [Chitinophagaceae bacterium]|nr:UDP-N-acetylmuramate dehydrogenase [Chitinophagaceae bacterium]
MQIQQNISLKPYNTFGIEARAAFFTGFSTADELGLALDYLPGLPLLVLGGGSNILFTRDFPGLVLQNRIPGIEQVGEDEEFVYVRAGAGENWHGFVQHCLARGWGGVENLSLIPGQVGASPMQNIGAYGVEIREVFHDLQAFHLHDRTLHTFTEKDCEFGYRESVFKGRYRGQFAILEVTFRLTKRPRINTRYGAIEEELARMGVQQPGIAEVSQAVIRIRQSKLPDPRQVGNAGSFFKNPSVPGDVFRRLQQQYPRIVGHPSPDGRVKLAAGWLIEQCGWKGVRRGDAGCHDRQALVLVNYGQATGGEIYRLSEEILQSVQEKFGVVLEREVNIL